jgi:hypothetical protein
MDLATEGLHGGDALGGRAPQPVGQVLGRRISEQAALADDPAEHAVIVPLRGARRNAAGAQNPIEEQHA